MEQPIDRGEIDRASLEATERLRSRLTGKPVPAPSRGRPVLPWVLAAALLTFALGLIANPWFEHNVRARLPFAAEARTADPLAIAALDAKVAALEARAAPAAAAAMPSERLAATEARVDSTGDALARDAARIDQLIRDFAALSARVEANGVRIASLSDATRSAADRAQAVLAVQLVRRALDAGRPLGPLDGALRQAFEARYPAAVQAVSALGAAPVTLASLRRDFEAVRRRSGGAAPGPAGAGRTWFEALRDTIDGAFAAAPDAAGTQAAAPIDLAAQALARGDTAAAANALRRLPNATRGYALGWIAAADRLRAGGEAMLILETATALLPPAAGPAALPAAPAAG